MNQRKICYLFLLVFANVGLFFITTAFAHKNIYVHPYITEQAFWVWPNDTNHEIYENLGLGYRDQSNWWEWPDYAAPFCNDSSTGGTIDDPGGTITEGAKEEDDYNVVTSECNIVPDLLEFAYGFYHHFYEPDWFPPNGYNGADGAFAYAGDYLQRAISYYRDDNKLQAYWYLGKIAHLLADASVPAHVNNDPHPPLNGDSYEHYIGKNNNYLNWTFYAARNLEGSDETSLLDKQNITLEKLFWNLAQRSQYFPSNSYYGNEIYLDVNGSPENIIYGLTWFDGWEPNPNSLRNNLLDRISDDNCRIIGEHLMPLAIQYTAALYKFFWYEMHVDIQLPEDDVQVLNAAVFNGIGKIMGVAVEEQNWEWDFDYDGIETNFNIDATGQRVVHTFKQWGNKKIALRATSPGGTVVIVAKDIYVKPFKIDVDYPEGFESLLRTFSIAENPLINEYTWDFGDGSPAENGRESEHTYAVSDYYNVTLTLTLDDGSAIQSQQGIFVGPGTRFLPGHTISGYETWYSGGTYHLLGNITVAQSGTLTIEPGVVVKFQSGGQLNVYGTLDAKDVTFTWADGENQWYGIRFYDSQSSASQLDGCIIEHARGSSGSLGIIYAGGSSPTITGCTIRDSVASKGIEIANGAPMITNTTVSGMTNYGIYVVNNSSPTVTGCTLADNGYGIYVNYSANNPVFSGNTYSNNSEADLMATGTILGAITWGETTDSVYTLSNFTVAEGASLSIASGMTIKFQPGGQLNVYGTLDAKDVTFTWADGENQWYGIRFYDSQSSASQLDGCIIEHARGSSGSLGIIYAGGSSPTITGCTIRDSVASKGIEIANGAPMITNTTVSGMTNYGIYVVNNSSPTVTGCTLADNGYGIYVNYSANNPVFSGNTYSNNSEADLMATGTILGAITWGETTDSVYTLSNFTVAEGASLSIASGMTIKFQPGGQLNVYGTLDAKDVTFTWADGENQWYGIRFYDSQSSASQLDGCIIEHARGSSGSLGIIYAGGSSPTITGCTIRDSVASKGIEIANGAPMITNTTVSGMTNYGIYVVNNSSPTVTGCTLADNGYGIYVNYSANNPVFSGNTYSNNSEADLMATGTILGAITWGETTDSVYTLSNFTVAQGASLSIASGMTIKFQPGGQLNVYGTLDAKDVTFTWADGENQWYGIRFYDSQSSASQLDGCIIEHPRGSSGSLGIIYAGGSSPTITGCTIRDSVASKGIEIANGAPMITNTTVSGMTNYGIYVANDSSPTVTGCTLADNNYGVYITSSGNGTYLGNTIAGNTLYGMYNSGTTIVNATNNFWGDITGPLDLSDDRNTGGWYNPDGLGDSVSNFVEYFPWIDNPEDMDGDSMPDDWEWAIVDADPNDSIEHPLDVLPFDDFDGDGFSNLREFLSFSGPVFIGSIPLCWGDFLRDGDVDGADLSTFSVEIGKTDCSPTDPCSCDLDSNGLVDTIDLLFFAEDFARTDCY